MVVIPQVAWILSVRIAVALSHCVQEWVLELVEVGRFVRAVVLVSCFEVLKVAPVFEVHKADAFSAVVGNPGLRVAVEVGSDLKTVDVGD